MSVGLSAFLAARRRRRVARALHRAGFRDFMAEAGSDGTVFVYPGDDSSATVTAYGRALQDGYRVYQVGTYVVVHP